MPLSDTVLRYRVALQPWTQNIRLSDHVTTLPGAPDFLATDLRLHAILRSLTLVYRGQLAGLRVADLGCLEGGFALALAQRGAEVLGVEARERNLEKARLLKEHFALANLEFAQGDVKDFTVEAFGSFDVVLALGILYHLDDPVRWLRQVSGATRQVLIVDTHFAPADDADAAKLDPIIARLGPLERMPCGDWVAEGRWFRETEGGTVDAKNDFWAAYSNERSFWLTKESLLIALSQAGFDLVLEQQDWMLHQYRMYTINLVRGLFLAGKSGAPVTPSGPVTPVAPPPLAGLASRLRKLVRPRTSR